jgi:hypothetical protein
MLACALWSIGSVLVQTDTSALARAVTDRLPARGIAIYAWTVVVLNALVWLRGIVPTITADDPGAFLVASGVTSQPVYVQDLAIWLPLMAVAALWLWRGRAHGFLLTASLLVLWVLEAVGIGVDQWFGSQADPNSVLASASMTPLFLIWAAIGTVPVFLALRALRRVDVPSHGATVLTTEGIS